MYKSSTKRNTNTLIPRILLVLAGIASANTALADIVNSGATCKPLFGTTTEFDIAYDMINGSIENRGRFNSMQVVCPVPNDRTEGAPRITVNLNDRNPNAGANISCTRKSISEDGRIISTSTKGSNSSFSSVLPIFFNGPRFPRGNHSVYLFCTIPAAVNRFDSGRSEIVSYKVSP